MSTILAGADVGGSTSRVVVTDGGKVLGIAEGPGAALRPERVLASAATIVDVVRRALANAGQLRADALVIGAAGAGREAEREELRQALRVESLAAQLRITTDIEIALEGAFGNQPGIVLTAGTGSIGVARDPAGVIHRSGGYGWQMGDEGSGYSIGRSALGAVGRAADGPAARASQLDDLVRWSARAGPAEVAGLAPIVLDVAATGDLTARGILDYAARELSQLVFHLVPHFPGDVRVTVACNGGLISPGRPLFPVLKAKVEEQSRLTMRDQAVDPVEGALAMARALIP